MMILAAKIEIEAQPLEVVIMAMSGHVTLRQQPSISLFQWFGYGKRETLARTLVRAYKNIIQSDFLQITCLFIVCQGKGL